MSDLAWAVVAVVAALLGALVGAWAASRSARGRRSTEQVQALESTQALTQANERHAVALAAAKAEAVALRASLKKQVEEAGAVQRQEIARLEMHLVGALDEVERLRMQVAATPRAAPDTGQDYPATLPMQYRP